MKILIVRLGALGDIIHALPVAAALREQYPSAAIDWLVDARYAAVLDLVPIIDRLIVVAARRRVDSSSILDGRAIRFGAGPGWLQVIRALRRGQYDAAVDLQGLVKSAALARVSGARRVVGFARAHLREKGASFFYGEHCWPPAGGHVVWKNLSALSAFGVPRPSEPAFPLAPGDTTALDQARREHPAVGDGFVLLNPGAAWPNKRWPASRFASLAAHLRQRHRLTSVVVWGPREERLAQEVVNAAGGAAVQAPPTTLPRLLALARAARLVVSGDTGPLHIGAAVGTPVVALFGPTDPLRNGPWAPADISISRYEQCECRYKRKCRREVPCMEEITVEQVSSAVDLRLSR